MKNATLKDGFGISIAFGGDATFFDDVDPNSITPPGVDGGDKIDATTHSNTEYRTAYPRQLKEITDCSFTAAYDPDAWDGIVAQINVNQLIQFTFPNGHVLDVYGYLKSCTPNEYVEGEGATCEAEIVITNVHDTTGVETGPNVSAVGS